MGVRPRFALLIPVIFTLAACNSTQTEPKTLSQQLEGKSPQEKQEILRLACLNEAEYTTDIKKAKHRKLHGSRHRQMLKDTAETKRLKDLCREMTDSYASIAKK